MGNPTTNDELLGEADPSGESTLRGEALAGSERRRAADHTAYKKSRNPDTVVRVEPGQVIVLRDVISAATPQYWEFWIGLAADDSLLMMRDKSTQEIYSLDVRFP